MTSWLTRCPSLAAVLALLGDALSLGVRPELFEGIAGTVVVPFDDDWRNQLTTLATELGAEERAAALLR